VRRRPCVRCYGTRGPVLTRVVVVGGELTVVVVRSKQLKRRPNLIGNTRQRHHFNSTQLHGNIDYFHQFQETHGVGLNNIQ
jgi:hypothetical protein